MKENSVMSLAYSLLCQNWRSNQGPGTNSNWWRDEFHTYMPSPGKETSRKDTISYKIQSKTLHLGKMKETHPRHVDDEEGTCKHGNLKGRDTWLLISARSSLARCRASSLDSTVSCSIPAISSSEGYQGLGGAESSGDPGFLKSKEENSNKKFDRN